MEYHLTIHLSGEGGRDCTVHDQTMLLDYLLKINVKRYVCVIEKAKHHHIHCVFTLSEPRPNIKRDIKKAMHIDWAVYPKNAFVCSIIKRPNQSFEMLGGGYHTKADYKYYKTYGISDAELIEGKEQYEERKQHSALRLSKHNLISYICTEMSLEEKEELDWKNALIRMMRSPKYNMFYCSKTFTEEEIEMYIYYAIKEPSGTDEAMLGSFLKKPNNY